ncbi:MAG: hypothetical protein LBP56_05200 [Odoribacteraceae bacterium]|jgi:hypothetical protein|nr:hypothetical protein [Odoribacteraceae bacterium]
MITPDIIKQLLLYFSRYVTREVRETIFKIPKSARSAEYAELQSDVLALDESRAFPDVKSFILSISEEYVSDRVKMQSDRVLFVEYGDISITRTTGQVYNDTRLAISVACNLNKANNDMITEAIKMQRNLDILKIILADLQEENKRCGLAKPLDLPASVTPLDPTLFFWNGGWTAHVNRRDLVLV